MNWQTLLQVGGVALAGLGVLALVAPGLFDIDAGRIAVTLVGVLAVILALWLASVRNGSDRQQARTPDPERRWPTPSPGEELHEVTSQFQKQPHSFYRLSVREGLSAAVVAVLTRYRSLSDDEARDRLEEGTWTDDGDASRFLQGTRHSAFSIGPSVKALLSGESTYHRGIRRCVESIAAIAEVPADTTTSDRSTLGRFLNRQKTNKKNQLDELTSTNFLSRTGVLQRRQTGRWRGIGVVVLVSVGVGLLAGQPGVLLIGVVGLCYAAYAQPHDFTPGTLSIERSLDETEPEPGDTVEVTVTLENEGGQLLSDIRVVDGVPRALDVVAGSPRLGTVLRPGEATEFSYTVTARRGVHTFDPTLAIVRNFPGTLEYECGIAPPQQTALTCSPVFQELPVSVPLRQASTHYAGVQTTSSGGEGTEFYATRQYQPGDTKSRIDWNQRAKTGELHTLLFREERAASVVLLVDTNSSAYVSPRPHDEHALDRSVDAAGQVFTTLVNQGHFVGLGALEDPECWLDPGAGTTHRARAQHLLATHPTLQSVPSDREENPIRARRVLWSRLPPACQVFVFSPLCRQSLIRSIRRLEAGGYPVTVVSPNPTTGGSPSKRLAQVGRKVTITDLRRDGIPVVDWDWNDSIEMAIAEFAKGGSVR